MKKEKIIKNLLNLLISISLILTLSSMAYSVQGGLNVVLSSQNPDPVSPGNFVYLNVKLSNSAESSSSNTYVRFLENKYLKIAPGENINKNIGIIPSYSSLTTSGNYVIVKFKVQVSPETPSGLNTVSIVVESRGIKTKYDLQVLVQNRNPNLIVNKFIIKPIQAGGSNQLIIDVENPNSISLKNILLSLGLDKVIPIGTLSTDSNSNQKLIPILKPNQKMEFKFNISVSPNAESKPYILPILITYQDSLENNFSKKVLGSIKVFSKSILSLELSSQEIYTKGISKINLAIANPGTSTIKGTQIQILASNDYDVLEGGYDYVGNLNPDDFQSLQAKINFKSNKDFNLKVKETYLDSYNNIKEKIVLIPIKIYNDSQLKSLGLISKNSNNSSKGEYIIELILLIITFFIGRKFGYLKGKKR